MHNRAVQDSPERSKTLVESVKKEKERKEGKRELPPLSLSLSPRSLAHLPQFTRLNKVRFDTYRSYTYFITQPRLVLSALSCRLSVCLPSVPSRAAGGRDFCA